jgi:hypothetical protein
MIAVMVTGWSLVEKQYKEVIERITHIEEMEIQPTDVMAEVIETQDMVTEIKADYPLRLAKIEAKFDLKTEDRFHSADFKPAFDEAIGNALKKLKRDNPNLVIE